MFPSSPKLTFDRNVAEVRCTGERPACTACKKHAVTLGRDPDTFICKYGSDSSNDNSDQGRPGLPEPVPVTLPAAAFASSSSSSSAFSAALTSGYRLESPFEDSARLQRRINRKTSSLSLTSTSLSPAASTSSLNSPPSSPSVTATKHSRPGGVRKHNLMQKLATTTMTATSAVPIKRPNVFKNRSQPASTRDVAVQTLPLEWNHHRGSTSNAPNRGRQGSADLAAAGSSSNVRATSQRRHTLPLAQPMELANEFDYSLVSPYFLGLPIAPSSASPVTHSSSSLAGTTTFGHAVSATISAAQAAPASSSNYPFGSPDLVGNPYTSCNSLPQAPLFPSTPPNQPQSPWTTEHAPHMTLSPSLSEFSHHNDDLDDMHDSEMSSSPLDDLVFNSPSTRDDQSV
ncbi:hypothetical protein ACM66B_001043 [Microbotryomycetes sp. NB124-2]